MKRLILPLIAVLAVVPGIDSGQAAMNKGVSMTAITIESEAFRNGQAIPSSYTCEGADRSPPLRWHGVPAAAKSLALICDDPDAPAGRWVHWAVYRIPASRDSLPEAVSAIDTVPGVGLQGVNSFGKIGYNGPCPPGGTHRYFFRLYALDLDPDLGAGRKVAEVERAMKGHILAQGELMGTYSRK